MRGNLPLFHNKTRRLRSNPARAGEPGCRNISSSRAIGLSPRVRGNRYSAYSQGLYAKGLSPRVRGNRLHLTRKPPGTRSIPARAGEPTDGYAGRVARRSIPARAGEPYAESLFLTSYTAAQGLSPRVRGNHQYSLFLILCMRSIPARAGEPPPVRPLLESSGVYPRACGGTRPVVSSPGHCQGLSPRVRGNHFPVHVRVPFRGSIPARAGEPSRHRGGSNWPRVYPRACGGTNGVLSVAAAGIGLSPRVRGNRGANAHWSSFSRSIPARAGEPVGFSRLGYSQRVYPRACGGTSSVWRCVAPGYPRACGLSPRVRGNPLMSLNVWFVSRRDSFRGYVKDCFRRAVMRRLHVPDRDG